MISHNRAAALQKQMQNTRQDLDEHAEEMVNQARSQLNWRHLVAQHPWAALGAAAVIGYLVVPRRTCYVTVTREFAIQATDRPAQKVAAGGSPVSDLLAGITSAAATIVARQSLAFATNFVNQWMERRGSHASSK